MASLASRSRYVGRRARQHDLQRASGQDRAGSCPRCASERSRTPLAPVVGDLENADRRGASTAGRAAAQCDVSAASAGPVCRRPPDGTEARADREVAQHWVASLSPQRCYSNRRCSRGSSGVSVCLPGQPERLDAVQLEHRFSAAHTPPRLRDHQHGGSGHEFWLSNVRRQRRRRRPPSRSPVSSSRSTLALVSQLSLEAKTGGVETQRAPDAAVGEERDHRVGRRRRGHPGASRRRSNPRPRYELRFLRDVVEDVDISAAAGRILLRPLLRRAATASPVVPRCPLGERCHADCGRALGERN